MHPFYGDGSIVVDSLFIVALIVSFAFGPCLVCTTSRPLGEE